jgi:hypothetical protein
VLRTGGGLGGAAEGDLHTMGNAPGKRPHRGLPLNTRLGRGASDPESGPLLKNLGERRGLWRQASLADAKFAICDC